MGSLKLSSSLTKVVRQELKAWVKLWRATFDRREDDLPPWPAMERLQPLLVEAIREILVLIPLENVHHEYECTRSVLTMSR